MATAKQRATAARKAYKSAISDVSGKDTGTQYSPRAVAKAFGGGKRARAIGKQISRSAANPQKRKSTTVIRKRTAAIGPKSTINFTKLTKTLLTHASVGEVKGVERDIRQAYRKNLKKATRKGR